MYKYVGIIVNSEASVLDKIFTYKIPEKLLDKIDIGFRVKVPFGMGNKSIDGFVLYLYEEDFNVSNISKIKEIKEICDKFAVLRKEDILLVEKMREKYLCTYLEAIKVMIPTGIMKGMDNKTKTAIYIGKPLEEKYNKPSYSDIYKIVEANDGVFSKSELAKEFQLSESSINTMLKHGFLLGQSIVINRFNTKEYSRYDEKILNDDQYMTLAKIINSQKKIFLIHGITGSGKTEIYMSLVSKMLSEGKEAIILVPEISLTPQMVERFKGRFGRDIAVFHSRLSDGERYDEWMRVKDGRVKVAVGARSAVFLPFTKLGVIIIDEEHETSYKSESDPKYNAKEIAEMRGNIDGCKIVLGSATPAFDTYYKCKNGNIELITLDKRADGALLPEIEVVDMRVELENNNKSMFSRKLHLSIKECLQKKEQVILFLNRRGYSTFVSCRKCGYVFKCNNCDISLTYHIQGGFLTCHYCGNKQKITTTCPKCQSHYVKYFGVGTEKVEQEVKRIFPEAKILRMDFDTTRKKDSYENIYNIFKEQKADVLIGTQMIAKGLDFKNVTLVGIIAADLSLNVPDFRSEERTFQLITQVSGRAGRGEKKGKVILQTYSPENPSIKYSAENDYKSFYAQEIAIRRDMNYPPFSNILCINLNSKNEELLIKNIQNIGVILKNKLTKSDKIEMLGPCPCGISKIKEQYRWQIILKGNIGEAAAMEYKNIVYESLSGLHGDIKVNIDINPNSLL